MNLKCEPVHRNGSTPPFLEAPSLPIPLPGVLRSPRCFSQLPTIMPQTNPASSWAIAVTAFCFVIPLCPWDMAFTVRLNSRAAYARLVPLYEVKSPPMRTLPSLFAAIEYTGLFAPASSGDKSCVQACYQDKLGRALLHSFLMHDGLLFD